MKGFSAEAVAGSAATGDGDSHSHKWFSKPSENKFELDDFDNYEFLFKAFMEKVFNGKGKFKIGGNLEFEFEPTERKNFGSLISPETSYYFHRMAEGVVYSSNDEEISVRSYHNQNLLNASDQSGASMSF